MNDRQQLAALGEEMAERAMELFEQKSPHQLAMELADAQKMCMEQADLLREISAWILTGDAGEFGEVVRRIDALLAGKVPEPAAPVAKKPRITGVNGLDAEFSVKFPDGLDGDPRMHFQSLCIDGDGISGGQHICAMLAAANWLIDKAEWYRKGSLVINQPCVWFDAAKKPQGVE